MSISWPSAGGWEALLSTTGNLSAEYTEAEWTCCRPSYRHDYDLDTSRQGDYTIRGYLYRPDDSLGYQDGRSYYSRQYPGYRRSYDGYYGRTEVSVQCVESVLSLTLQETCPYQNEKLSRKKREAGSEGSDSSLLLTRLRNDYWF